MLRLDSSEVTGTTINQNVEKVSRGLVIRKRDYRTFLTSFSRRLTIRKDSKVTVRNGITEPHRRGVMEGVFQAGRTWSKHKKKTIRGIG